MKLSTCIFAEHLVAGHAHLPHPQKYFKSCEQCCGWRVKVANQNKQEDTGDRKGNISHIYNAPVTTNNYYALPQTPPLTTPTSDSSHRGNSLLSIPIQCQSDDIGSGGGRSHDLNGGRRKAAENYTKWETTPSRLVLSGEATLSSRNSPSHSAHCLRSSGERCMATRLRTTQNSSGHNKKDSPQYVKSLGNPTWLQDGPVSSSLSHNRGVSELEQLGRRLFDVAPYHFIKRYYRGWKKEVLRSLLVVLFIYQTASAGLMTICEDGGFRAVFNSGEVNCYPEVVNRLLKFFLRIICRVVLPLCCTVHLPVLATAPAVPTINFSQEEAVKRLMRIHENFSSEEEVTLLRHKSDIVLSKSEEMAKRRIGSMWITVTHSFFMIFLLVYLGAFYVCEQNTMRGGVCNFLSVTIIHVPYLNINFHFIIAMESFTVLMNFLIIGVVGDCYNYENRIATYAVIIGGEARKLFGEIRRRWLVMDRLVCATPLVMGGILALSMSTGRLFVSTPIQAVQASDLADWYFWIMVLTVLMFLGNSSNRMAKKACIAGYAIAGALIFTVEVETSHIPYGSIMVLVYTLTSAYILNHLICLGRCYHSNASSCMGWFQFVSIVFLTSLLLASLFITTYREIAHFSSFVAW